MRQLNCSGFPKDQSLAGFFRRRRLFVMDREKAINDGLAGVEPSPQQFAALGSRLFDLLQAHGLPTQFLTNRPAQEAVLIEYPDLCKISRIVANEDLFFDAGSQGRIQIRCP